MILRGYESYVRSKNSRLGEVLKLILFIFLFMAQSYVNAYKSVMLKIGHISIAALMVAGLITVTPIASAQTTSGQTTQQTDQSEEDWRNSQKKPGSDDIFEDIRNNRSTGTGSVPYGPTNPLDSLPEESRRHLTRERAKALATGDPNAVGDTPYTPSEAAKTDPNLEQQEKDAWKAIMDDLKNPGQGQSGQAGQQGQSGSQTGPQTGSQGQSGPTGGAGQRTPSVIRGGSSTSVKSILDRIKGRTLGGLGGGLGGTIPRGIGQAPPGTGQEGTGQGGTSNGGQQGSAPNQSPQGSTQNGSPEQGGTSQQGRAPQGSSPQGSSQGAGQQGRASEQGSSPQGTSPQGAGQDGASQGNANASDAGSQDGTSPGDAANAGGATDAANTPPPQGPLDRLKDRNDEREDNAGGRRTNALEFLRSRTAGD